MVIQFKTTQTNSQIAAMMSGSQSFAVNIQNGKLQLKYDFNLTGNGTLDLGMGISSNFVLMDLERFTLNCEIILSMKTILFSNIFPLKG